MRVLFRLWIVFTVVWFALLIAGDYHGSPALVWVVPGVPLGLGLALRWAFKGAQS